MYHQESIKVKINLLGTVIEIKISTLVVFVSTTNVITFNILTYTVVC